jgi:threonine dehydrogenase-like Zn-dependent dehydrogenase
MPAVVQFVSPGVVELIEEPSTPLAADAVRVATLFSGISAGTELTAFRGTNPYLAKTWDPDQRLFRDGAPTFAYPVAGWGYSEVGTVFEVGDEVPASSGPAVGEVVWGIWGHRSEAVVPAAKVGGHVLGDADPVLGVFARVGAIALNAVLAAEVNLGETVVVFGQGVIGLLATRLAVASGARVIAVDGIGRRRLAALSHGATVALDPFGPGDLASRVRELTAGRGADSAIELSGSVRALHEATRVVAPASTVAASGFYQGDATGLALGEEFHHNRVRIVGSQIGGVPRHLTDRWDVERLQQVAMSVVLASPAVADLVTHRFAAEQVADAFALLDQRGDEALQVVLTFGAAR